MRGRDIVLVGVLLLVGAVALVDAVRDGDGRAVVPTEPLPPPAPVPGRQPQPQRVAPEDFPRGVLDGLLIAADARDCQFRILSLAAGRERPVSPTAPLAEPCAVWAAPRGGLIAYPTNDFDAWNLPFLAVDEAAGPAVVSPDGEHAAWCRRGEGGVEFDVNTNDTRRLRACPDAYTADGDVAFIAGRRLLTEHETVLRASGPIHYASWAEDGSVAVIVANRFERWQGGKRSDSVEIPPGLGRWPPVPSPDNCAALFRSLLDWYEVVPLSCFRASRPDLLIFGGTAAWSPDGRWIAVAYSDRIGFHRVTDGEEVTSWPVRAAAIAWTTD
jgi:hypothetical protein